MFIMSCQDFSENWKGRSGDMQNNTFSSQRLVFLSWNLLGSSKSGENFRFKVYFSSWVYLHVWCMHVSVYLNTHAHAWEGQQMLDIFLYCFPPYCLKTECLSESEAHPSRRLPGQWALLTYLSLFSNAGLIGMCSHPCLLTWVLDLNSDPYAEQAYLPTEPSPKPWPFIFFSARLKG